MLLIPWTAPSWFDMGNRENASTYTSNPVKVSFCLSDRYRLNNEIRCSYVCTQTEAIRDFPWTAPK